MREKFNLMGKKAFEEFNPKPSACFLPSTIVSDVGSESEDNRTDQELQDHSKRGREDHSAAEHSVNKKRKHNRPKEVGKNVMAKEMMYKRRARNQRKVAIQKPDIVDADKYKPSQRSLMEDKFWIEELYLLERDRDILLSPAGWLTDNLIDAAQMLLRQAFPALSGLQSVCCGRTMNFIVEPAEFVQVIHNGRGHWLTVSTIGTSHPDIHVYDSMYPSVNTCVKTQIAAILHTESPAIRLQFMAVQKQAGGCDCGLFAVAFATALALGNPPGMYITLSRRRCDSTCASALRERGSQCFPTLS